MDILIAILTTILGVFLGQVVYRWDSWKQTAVRGDLRGEWLSISHAADEESVRDKITVSRKWGKLYLKNNRNEFGYEFEAFCTIESLNILVGTWRSLRKGSVSKGRVLLIISPQATSMSGVYSGKGDDGRDVILGWAMAKDEIRLEQAVIRIPSIVMHPKWTKLDGQLPSKIAVMPVTLRRDP